MKIIYDIMNRNITILAGILAILAILACSKSQIIEVTNNENFDRPGEVIEVNLNGIELQDVNNLILKDKNDNTIPFQLIDLDNDGTHDQLIFQADLKAGEIIEVYCESGKPARIDSATSITYCRYVPERMGDFAWENDRVAFRMYGPECQRVFEEGNPAGLISSGIDCWLKRVPYPIINKWYKKESNGGSYHQDDGEGLDNFTVGKSRGCGGTAIRNNGSYILSTNFYEWEVIANGPIRSIFELRFKPVEFNGKLIGETKRFTMDAGSNLYKCEITFEGDANIDTVGIGLTLHNNLGITSGNDIEGWISYWEPLDDSEIGMGILIGKDKKEDSAMFLKTDNDQENYWLLVSPEGNQLTYFAGFGWKKSGDFVSIGDWETYLENQSRRIGHPPAVKFAD